MLCFSLTQHQHLIVAPVSGDVSPSVENAGGRSLDQHQHVAERRLSWAQLMLRVFEKDVLECPRCGGRRRLIAVITESTVIVAFLGSLGLPTRAPPRGRAREEDPGEEEPGEADPLAS